MEGNPFCSVIVTAYTRREFILEALDSVISQNVPRESYEIILISNFNIDENFIKQHGIKFIFSDVKEIGMYISLALEHCRGEVVCFLDDDDVWCPNKLNWVYSIFKSDTRLCYYHNNLSTIDDNGVPIIHPIHRNAIMKIEKIKRVKLNSDTLTYHKIRRAVKLASDFNSSCISIRKSVLLTYRQYLKRLSISVDTFCFYASLLTKNSTILIDSEKLTKYRIHSNQISRKHSNILMKRIDMGIPIIMTMIRETSTNTQLLKSLRVHISDNAIESFWIKGYINRREMLRCIINHLSLISFGDLDYNLLLLLFAISYLVFPSITRSIYFSQYYGGLQQ
jgi:glycosyltransferase involved in cell wall biosynthesis